MLSNFELAYSSAYVFSAVFLDYGVFVEGIYCCTFWLAFDVVLEAVSLDRLQDDTSSTDLF